MLHSNNRYSMKLVFAAVVAIGLIALGLGGAVAAESHDPLCGSCHTQPEVEYLERSRREPSDLASLHSHADIGCIECHSGAGILGRAISLKQGASDLAAFLSGEYAAPAATTNPVGQIGCTKCHDLPSSSGRFARTQGGVTSSHYHFIEYGLEWMARVPDNRGTCAACHGAHVKGGFDGFRDSEAEQAACDACHATLSGWIPPRR